MANSLAITLLHLESFFIFLYDDEDIENPPEPAQEEEFIGESQGEDNDDVRKSNVNGSDADVLGPALPAQLNVDEWDHAGPESQEKKVNPMFTTKNQRGFEEGKYS